MARKSAKKPAKTVVTITADCPPENVFWLVDGRVLRNLRELDDALGSISKEAFSHHANKERNDFANWVRDVVKDKDLADSLEETKSRAAMIDHVERRLEFLEGINTEPRISTFFMRYTVVDFLIGVAIGIIAGYMIAKFVVP